MNQSSCQLYFMYLNRLFRMQFRIFRPPAQFDENRRCVGKVFVIAHLKARNILIHKIYLTNFGNHVVALQSILKFVQENDENRSIAPLQAQTTQQQVIFSCSVSSKLSNKV